MELDIQSYRFILFLQFDAFAKETTCHFARINNNIQSKLPHRKRKRGRLAFSLGFELGIRTLSPLYLISSLYLRSF